GEDVEDHVGAVEDADAGVALGEGALEIAHLRRGELAVEDHDLRAVLVQCALDLVDLSRAREGRRVGTVAPPADHLDHFGARALDEARGFVRPVPGVAYATDVEGDENSAGALRTLADAQAGPRQATRGPSWSAGACRSSEGG